MKTKAKIYKDISLIKSYYKEQIRQLLGLHKMLVKYPELPDSKIAEKHDQLSDLILFIIQSNLDLTICCKNIMLHRELGSDYEMQYFARAIAVHCYDAIQEPPGKQRLVNRIKEIIKQYKEPELNATVDKISNACDTLSNILIENKDYIKGIRDNLFAHRDMNAIEQHRAMENIDPGRIGGIGEEIDHTLYSIIRDLLTIQQFVVPVIEETPIL